MNRFDALSRHTPISESHLLEASAGTGKTFSIENIVARLIVDPVRPLLIEEILVVTFTKAATQDLKRRIWDTLSSLVKKIKHLEEQEQVPDYLLEIIEQGLEALQRAKRLWDQALFSFDRAQIFTLHSFCYRMLREFLFEGGLNRDALTAESALSKKMICKAIQDYFMIDDPEKNRKLQAALTVVKDGDTLLEYVLNAILKGTAVKAISQDDHLGIFVRDCQTYFKEFEKKEEASSFDSILKEMDRAVQNPDFAHQVRERFRAAIIDEFQDTDPTQWSIFRTLFLVETKEKPTLYLVGDPKQSIYSFRQADVYTYLEAARALGKDHIASLDTNYRSSPELVEALNYLFSSTGLIQLPRLKETLDIPKVKAGKKESRITFKDNWGAVHFFAAERKKYSKEKIDNDFFIPFLVNEIQRLIMLEGVNPRQCAILVKDHHQAARVIQGLKKAGIPYHNQRSEKLVETAAFDEMRTLLNALINPRNIGKLKLTLGGQIFGWTAERILGLQDLDLLEKVLIQFYRWRQIFLNEGISAAFTEMMKTVLPTDNKSNAEKILERESGLRFYQDLYQTVELLAAEQSKRNILSDALTTFMDELAEEEQGDEAKLFVRQDPDADSVVITTIHSSKGLEYDIVFALGVAQRPRELKGFELHHDGEKVVQSFFEKNDPQLEPVARENSAEHMRQFYVTLTRAKYRLYIPVIITAETKKELEKTSPIEQFLYKNGGIDSYSKLQKYVEEASTKCSISYSLIGEGLKVSKMVLNEPKPKLIEPEKVPVPGAVMNMYSYSALTKGTSKSHLPVEHTGLPSSGDVGNFLHNLLEDVSFDLSRSDLENALQTRIEGSLYREWKEEIIQMIYDALNVSLPLKTGKISLSAINLHKIFRETEFMFPWNESLNLPDVTPLPGYLKGVIDLVFEHEGFYYILDWKSNVLQGYDKKNLQQAMEDNHYLLQAEVYREAWRRFIKNTDPRPFEDVFGGIFYVFLRGLKSGEGVYDVR